MLKPALVFFLFVALAHGHMTGVCLSRISDGRLQVAVEHWHGGTAVRSGASFAIRQGGLVASGPWQAPLACDCPDRNGCATSYHDCGCNGNGIWFAIVADPGFVPGNVQVQGINGGSVTAGCGSCTEVSGVTTATMPLPPPASTCFADICGDGIISGPEVCEIGGSCAPGYPPTTCGTCCVTGTPCCQTGNAVCRNTVVNLDNSGQATVTFGAIDNGSTLSADCPQPGYPQVTPSTVNCADFPTTSVSLLVGPAGAANGETCTATVTVNDPIPPQISCPSSIVRGTDTNQCHAAVSYSTPVGTDQCPGASTTRTAGQASGTNFGVGTTTNTFVVTDQASLTASCSFTVTVSDDQGPSISCPSSMTVAATGPSCTAPVTFTAPVGTDNCPGASTSQTAGLPSGSTFPLGPTTQTFQVTDATGRTASCSFTVTVTDGQSPSITCPSSISVNSDAGICGAVVTYTAPVGTDNCSGSSTALTAGLGSGSTFPVGSTTETYQVTDLGGRTASCSFTVTVTDNENPTIDGSNGSTPCPAPMTVNTDRSVCEAGVFYTTPVGTDNCPGASTALTGGIPTSGTFPLGSTTNSYTVTDAVGLTSSCSFAVTVVDNEDPVIDGSLGSTPCPAPITVNSAPGTCAATVSYTTPVGDDACPGATTAQTAGGPSGSTFAVGTSTQTFEVTDAAGGSASCSFDVTVVDAERPTISCPSSMTVGSDAGVCGATVSYSFPTGGDNCPGATIAITGGLGSGSFFPAGPTTETYEVTDAAGLTATCSFTITVLDPENPTIDGTNGSTPCPSAISQNTDPNVCQAAVSYTPPVGTDNCPGASTALTGGIASGGTFPLGSTTNSYTVTDTATNTASCSFSVTIVDNEDPVIDGSLGSTACPAPVTVNNTPGSCAATVSYTLPVGADACPGATTALTAGGASGSSFPVGTSTQTYMVTDAVGRSASCSFDVTVVDAERPTISCPSPITVNSDAGVCGATVFYAAPTTQDNCPGFTSGLTAGLGSGSVFPVGTTTDTYVVTDAAGLTATCSLTITVLDGESPTIDGTNGSTPCPPAISQSNDSGACQAVVTFTSPVGTDQCPGASTALTSGIASGGTFPLGVTQNEYTVTDAAGNSAQCFLTITIVDSEGPHIDGTNGSTGCPASFSVNSDAGQCGAVVTYTDPVATDSCPGVSTSRTAGLASGSVFGVGATTQTFTATDSAGNTASCSFTITVLDADPPTIDGSNGSSPCPSTITANAATNTCQAAVSYATPVGTDQCPGESTAQTAGLASGSLFNVGTTVNTFVVMDASSNTASCSFNVVVVDAQPPSIDGSQGSTPCPAPITVNNDAGLCSAVVTYTAPVGTDSCAGASTALTAGLGSGAAFPAPGPTTETYVVTDAAGQTASCSFTVTVNDVDDPVMDGSNGSTACPAPVSVNTDAGVCHAAVTYTAANGVDQCGATTTLTAGLASGSNFPLGSTTNTFTAADSAGNAVSCSFTVTVTDNEDPVIDGTLGSTGCPAPIAVNNDAGRCGAVVTYTTPVGTDGCAGAVTTLASGLGSGGFFPVGTTTETYLVTDASGRTASCSFTVSVIDNEPPTLNSSDGFTPCMPPVVVGNDAGACSAVVNYAVPAGNDNCGTLTPTLVSGLGTGGTFPQFTSTETWTATDASGNSVTCSFDVVVEDREPPVISHSPAGVVQAFPGEPYNYVVSMTDNCSPDTFSHVSGPMPGDMSNTPTDPTSVLFQGVDMAGNTVQYEFHVQTIFVATGVPVPTYMYVPMGLDMATAAFPGDTHVTYQLRPIGGGQAVFESVRATLSDHVEFEGASQVLPGRWEFWMVGWPSANARFGQEFILCASEHFCY